MDTWKTTPRAVTLTNDQWCKLSAYLLMTETSREDARKAWARLAAETKEDGSPRYENAASTAAFYAELCETLDLIRKVIDRY